MEQKEKIEIVKMATKAAKKWFYEEFEDDLLQKMEHHELITQAEGYSVSMAADLQVSIELEILGELVQDIEDNLEGAICETGRDNNK